MDVYVLMKIVLKVIIRNNNFIYFNRYPTVNINQILFTSIMKIINCRLCNSSQFQVLPKLRHRCDQ